ncbi:MAG: hypothetical protein SGILL_004541 [Bacillariaceae sp.]
MLSNVGSDPKTRITKLLWAAPRSGKDSSKARRRLHFALQLEHDAAAAESRQDDDDSFGSMGSYSPEVVKLLVGLKCGDEKLNLGTAKLVINGRETVEQKMDLIVQPYTGPNSGLRAKRTLFGKRQQKNTFTNGDHSFKLAQNATLRVKADIRTASPGQDGASVWGKDDSSYTTNWTYDTSNANLETQPILHPATREAMAAGIVSPLNTNAPSLDEQMASMGLFPGKDGSLFGESPTEMQYDPFENSMHRRVIHTVPPIPEVSLQKTEDKSYMSGLTDPVPVCVAPWWATSCLPALCGEPIEEPPPKKGSRACTGLGDTATFSFESISRRPSDDMEQSSDSSSSNDSSTTVVEDLQGTIIDVNNQSPKSVSQPQRRHKARKPQPKQDDEEKVEYLDVTVETYNDLRGAQETLMRYASRAGVKMEDLLEGIEHSQKEESKMSKSRRRPLKQQ